MQIKFQRWLAVDTNNSLNVYSTWFIYAETKQCWGFKITSIAIWNQISTSFQLWRAKFIRLINNDSSLTCNQGCCFFNHPKFIFQASLTMQFYENQVCNMLPTFWSVCLLQYMYKMLGRIKSNFVKGWGGNCALSLLGKNQNMKVCRTDSIVLCVYSSCMCNNSVLYRERPFSTVFPINQAA